MKKIYWIVRARCKPRCCSARCCQTSPPRQGDIVEDVEAVLPFVPVDSTIFPVKLSEVQELQEQDRSLRKQPWNNPKEFTKKK